MAPRFESAPGVLPPGVRVYAVGDVHGLDIRLAALHARIAADLAARPCPAPLLIQLGDYIDRGPDSAAVVARLAGGAPIPGLPTVCLMGNHERTMLDALAGERAAATDWLEYGGGAALASWGAGVADGPAGWSAAVPAAHRAWLAALPLRHRVGDYFFVHAGVRPGVALDRQAADDLLRIRGAFLHSTAWHGAVVVHGHTPVAAPEVLANRINLDTGAVFGRALSCAVLEDERIAFLTA
jgi:serine/threonine protein phosphatase 1